MWEEKRNCLIPRQVGVRCSQAYTPTKEHAVVELFCRNIATCTVGMFYNYFLLFPLVLFSKARVYFNCAKGNVHPILPPHLLALCVFISNICGANFGEGSRIKGRKFQEKLRFYGW